MFHNLAELSLANLPNLISIPQSLNQLTLLVSLLLTELPNLRGTFPSDLFISNKHLTEVDISLTSLSGNFSLNGLCHLDLSMLAIGPNRFEPWIIPECLSSIELTFRGPAVSGTISSGICSPKLTSVGLTNTSLTGTVPSCLGDLRNLGAVIIENNLELKGNFPAIYSQQLKFLHLTGNGFEGSISSILPMAQYPKLKLATFHSNHFHDEEVGSLLKRLFAGSPRLEVLTLYNNDYVGGKLPNFESPVYLSNFRVLAAHRLDLRGTLPSNLRFGDADNVTNCSLTLFDNRLSGEIPNELIPDSQNNTLLLLQGNLFGYESERYPPQWMDAAQFIDVSALYLGAIDHIESWGLLSVSSLCLLFVIIKTKYNFPFLRSTENSELHLVESIKIIEQNLTDFKMLVIICILLVFYPFFASYYSSTPILSHFSLFFFEFSSSGWKAELALLLAVYNIVVINITIKICVLGNSLNEVSGVLTEYVINLVGAAPADPPISDHESWCKYLHCFVADNKEHDQLDDSSNDTESTAMAFMKFIIYVILFLINLFLLFIYILSQSLPGNNVLKLSRRLQKVSSYIISFVIAINSSLIIPKIAHYSLRLCCCSLTKRVNQIILVLRTTTTIVIPIILSFILLNDCGSGWVYLWTPCLDDTSFDISVPLHIQTAFMEGYLELTVLHHEDVCQPLSLPHLNWNKCIRSFLYHWCNVLMVKMIIMMFMPIVIIFKKTLCRKVRGKHRRIEIDSEYAMLTTKLEIILIFGVFCPLLYPVIVAALNSFIYFYVCAKKTLKYDITFKNCERGLNSFPFHFLIFGIICEQILTVVFMKTGDGYKGFEWIDDAITWALLGSYLVMDILAVCLYRKRLSRTKANGRTGAKKAAGDKKEGGGLSKQQLLVQHDKSDDHSERLLQDHKKC